MIVGREIPRNTRRSTRRPTKRGFRSPASRRRARSSDISFTVHKGEIFGIYGLMGSGRSEIFDCLFGLDRPSKGEVKLFGQAGLVRRARAGDRCRSGAGHGGPQAHRPQSHRQHSPQYLARQPAGTQPQFRRQRDRAKRRRAARPIDRFSIQIGRDVDPVSSLSGGNQQKVVLGKWFLRNPTRAAARRTDARRRRRRQARDLAHRRRFRRRRRHGGDDLLRDRRAARRRRSNHGHARRPGGRRSSIVRRPPPKNSSTSQSDDAASRSSANRVGTTCRQSPTGRRRRNREADRARVRHLSRLHHSRRRAVVRQQVFPYAEQHIEHPAADVDQRRPGVRDDLRHHHGRHRSVGRFGLGAGRHRLGELRHHLAASNCGGRPLSGLRRADRRRPGRRRQRRHHRTDRRALQGSRVRRDARACCRPPAA